MDRNQNLQTWRRSPDLFWPIILIGVGVIWLLSNLGLIATDPLPVLLRFWPVILIVIGIDILFGRRGIWGSIVSALLGLLVVAGVIALLLVAQSNPTFLRSSSILPSAELHSEHITQPLGEVQRADVTINLGGGTNSVKALSGSSNLFEGDVSYYGTLVKTVSTVGDSARVALGTQSVGVEPLFFGGGQEKFNVGLNSGVAYNLALNTGSGRNEFDLSQLTVTSLSLDSGSGHVGLSLPGRGQYTFPLNVGSGDVIVRVPDGVATRVQYTIGSGAVDAASLTRNGDDHTGTFESASFSQSGPYVIIQVFLGSGHVSIE